MTLKISKEFLYEKYVEEKLSTIKIAKLCNCSGVSISKYLKLYDINIRSNNKARSPNAKWDLLENKDWLYQKYIDEKLTTRKISKLCNCGKWLIISQLNKFNIRIRPNGENRNPDSNYELLNSKDWLYQKYVDEKLNTYQIAELCNSSNSVVTARLKKFGIRIRPLNEVFNPTARWDLLNNKDWLKQKYLDEKLSTYQISKKCKCSGVLVGNQLKKFNINIRPGNEAHSPNARWDLLNNKEWLQQKYLDERISANKISDICKCSHGTIIKQLKQFDIEIKDQNGENNHQWQGGISYEPYCHKFNFKLKEEIRDKYNRKCVLCGKTEKENGKRLSVHHIDYNKDQGCNGHKWSLIPLCSSCHNKTNRNRSEWAKFFEELLE